MKVFISWSKDRSRHIAQSLRDWLPCVLQEVEPWMSNTDIGAGQNWQSELSKKLDDCRVGIICVTPENQLEPWLNFEAGALQSLRDKPFVCPYIFDMEPGDLKPPLGHFQSKRADKEGTKQLVSDINNNCLSKKVNAGHWETIFEALWAQFQAKLSGCPKPGTVAVQRSERDMIDEILENTRVLLRTRSTRSGIADPLIRSRIAMLEYVIKRTKKENKKASAEDIIKETRDLLRQEEDALTSYCQSEE